LSVSKLDISKEIADCPTSGSPHAPRNTQGALINSRREYMRIVESGAVDAFEQSSGFADPETSPADVLKLVDKRLADFGLEVVMLESSPDQILWDIRKIGD
jgi:hypothetical protein